MASSMTFDTAQQYCYTQHNKDILLVLSINPRHGGGGAGAGDAGACHQRGLL